MAFPGRTTQAAVQGIISVIANTDLTPYIDSANELVTEICTGVFPGVQQAFDEKNDPIYKPAPGGVMYTDHRLELIERWLSAHFYAVFDPRSTMERAGSVEQRLQGRTELGLKASVYGQTAMRMDTFGGLAIWDNGQEKYRRIPAAVLKVPIGVVHLGRSPGFHSPPWGGGWGFGGG